VVGTVNFLSKAKKQSFSFTNLLKNKVPGAIWSLAVFFLAEKVNI
jgi:hypothetical protein